MCGGEGRPRFTPQQNMALHLQIFVASFSFLQLRDFSDINLHEVKIYEFKKTTFKMSRLNMKLRDMDEKNMHNLFLKNMAGLIEEIKNPSPCLNP